MNPPPSRMAAAFGVATLVTLELTLVEIAVHSRADVVIGVCLAMVVVGAMALAGLALAAGYDAGRRLRARARQRHVDREFAAIAARLRPADCGDIERLGRALGVLDDPAPAGRHTCHADCPCQAAGG